MLPAGRSSRRSPGSRLLIGRSGASCLALRQLPLIAYKHTGAPRQRAAMATAVQIPRLAPRALRDSPTRTRPGFRRASALGGIVVTPSATAAKELPGTASSGMLISMPVQYV